MNNIRQLLRGALHFQRQNRLGDQLGRIRPDDVDAQDFSVLRIGHDLDEAFVLADDAGARVGGERELANLYLVARSFALASVSPTLPISGWQ